MIAILDYGSGNLRSAQRAFALTGEDVEITSDPEVALAAAGLVVPGVGAFGACMAQLNAIDGEAIIRRRIAEDKPLLGICVGMQILFTLGVEKGSHRGIGVFSGEVSQLKAPVLPHIGWNTVTAAADSTLFAGVEDQLFYFVHSYAAKGSVADASVTSAEYGESFIAAIESGCVSATQFHPEKSGRAGAKIIENWVSTL